MKSRLIESLCCYLVALCLVALCLVQNAAGASVRIKDIVDFGGQRTNTVTGMGLVVGLAGTGGNSPITRQFAANFLVRHAQRIDPLIRATIRNDTQQRTDNISVVTVTAALSVTAKPGQVIDGLVAAFDDADSLQGGQLLPTALIGVDNHVYAIASGPLSTGGFAFQGDAASVQKNHPTTATLPNGVSVEQSIPILHEDLTEAKLMLRDPDIQTAIRIVDAINQVAPDTAELLDFSTIRVATPKNRNQRAMFLTMIGNLRVEPDTAARVVINERTGTVVIGANVRLSQVALTHGSLSVITGETPEVVQPAPQSRGETAVVPRTQIDVIEEKQSVNVIGPTATVGDLAEALSSLGVSPRDLSSIFQRLHESGALHARLEMK